MASIFICGDISHSQPIDHFIGEDLVSVISSADYAIGNLEGVELPENSKSICGPFQVEGTISYLQKVGFDMMLLANNHITDYGSEILQQTIVKIETVGMHSIGAGLSYENAYRLVIREIDGLRFAFFNICEAQNGYYDDPKASYGYAWIGYPNLFYDIRKYSKAVDYLIVFVHFGLEHYVLPLPEVRDFYRCLCDSGATCVIGGHPHVAQGYELYKNKLIAYSLGNFYFPRFNNLYLNENVSFSILIEFKNKGIFEFELIHHSLRNGIVDVERSNPVDIAYLCNILGDGYNERVNEQCVQAYYHLCQRLLIESTCGENEKDNIVDFIKSILRRTIFRNKYVVSTRKQREKLLLHLFENESYRYTIIRALKNIILK